MGVHTRRLVCIMCFCRQKKRIWYETHEYRSRITGRQKRRGNFGTILKLQGSGPQDASLKIWFRSIRSLKRTNWATDGDKHVTNGYDESIIHFYLHIYNYAKMHYKQQQKMPKCCTNFLHLKFQQKI